MVEKMNIALFLWLNHFAGLSPLGDVVGMVMAKYMPLLFALWALYWWFARGKEGQRIVLYVAEATALGLTLNFIITTVYFHPRPFMLSLGTLLISHAPETSFPSDHATLMLTMALAALYFRPTRADGGVLLVWAFLGGMARVFCGLHFPLDIVGSLGVALVSTAVIVLFKAKLASLNARLLRLYDNWIGQRLPHHTRL